MWWPSLLTITRIFLSPIFFLLYVEYEALGISFKVLPYLLIGLLAVSELSDAFDGYVARRLNQVTDLGKILDPMADSISRISVFLTFTQGVIQLPLLLVFVFIYRDAVVSTLRTVCALRGVALAARQSGKVKAVAQAIVAFFILGLLALYAADKISLATLQIYSFWSVTVVAIYTLLSMGDYIWANRQHIKKLLQKRSPRLYKK